MLSFESKPTSENQPALPPVLPPGVKTFDSIDFGGYCARGYNPNQIAGQIRGIPIRMLTEGEWLGNNNTGSSGSVFVFRDQQGKEMGRAYKPSRGVVHDLSVAGKWPTRLVYTPSTVQSVKSLHCG
jgi:hypothetical protein